MDTIQALKVIWLGDYFKIRELVIIMIQAFVITQINNDNVIQFINESYAKLKNINKPNISRQNSLAAFPQGMTSSVVLQEKEREEEAWYDLLDT